MNLISLKNFVQEGFRADLKQFRSRFFLFFFNLIPDFYLLIPIRNILLKCGGANLPLFSCYIRSPFFTFNLKNIHISPGVFINKYGHIDGNAKVTISARTQIGPYLKIENVNHDIQNNMKTILNPVFIGDNVWIASNVTILPKTTIQSNTVIAAGAVVRGDISGGGVFGGVPAKKISGNKNE